MYTVNRIINNALKDNGPGSEGPLQDRTVPAMARLRDAATPDFVIQFTIRQKARQPGWGIASRTERKQNVFEV